MKFMHICITWILVVVKLVPLYADADADADTDADVDICTQQQRTQLNVQRGEQLLGGCSRVEWILINFFPFSKPNRICQYFAFCIIYTLIGVLLMYLLACYCHG